MSFNLKLTTSLLFFLIVLPISKSEAKILCPSLKFVHDNAHRVTTAKKVNENSFDTYGPIGFDNEYENRDNYLIQWQIEIYGVPAIDGEFAVKEAQRMATLVNVQNDKYAVEKPPTVYYECRYTPGNVVLLGYKSAGGP